MRSVRRGTRSALVTLVLLLASLARATEPRAPSAPAASTEPNPAIDMAAHLRFTAEAARVRETHRISEAEFQRLARDPATVILDARSRPKYDELHVKGAVNLSFPDMTAATLASVIPSKSTRVLIYCNNNFRNAEGPFPVKAPAASLNLSTYVTLYTYGYRNVFELAPLLDPKTCLLGFESTR